MLHAGDGFPPRNQSNKKLLLQTTYSGNSGEHSNRACGPLEANLIEVGLILEFGEPSNIGLRLLCLFAVLLSRFKLFHDVVLSLGHDLAD